MGISKRKFAVMNALRKGSVTTQRALAEQAEVSLGTVNKLLADLQEQGLAEGFALTSARHGGVGPL